MAQHHNLLLEKYSSSFTEKTWTGAWWFKNDSQQNTNTVPYFLKSKTRSPPLNMGGAPCFRLEYKPGVVESELQSLPSLTLTLSPHLPISMLPGLGWKVSGKGAVIVSTALAPASGLKLLLLHVWGQSSTYSVLVLCPNWSSNRKVSGRGASSRKGDTRRGRSGGQGGGVQVVRDRCQGL